MLSSIPNPGRRTALAAVAVALAAIPAVAAELPAGTRIDASTLDRLQNDTFEGKAIAGMLPDKLAWQIREKGLVVTLKPSQAWKADPRYGEWTNRNRTGGVKLAAGGKGIDNWQAGIPFPDIDAKDSEAAAKVIWNLMLGQPVGCYWSQPSYLFLTLGGNSGIEREMLWRFSRVNMVGRYCDPHGKLTLGDGTALRKEMLVALEPFDMRGTGQLSVQYLNGDVSRSWAYVRSVRRVRTISGSSWMDPVGGGTDMVNDDVDTFNAHPSWYGGYKYLGKRWVLAPANVETVLWNREAKSKAEIYPALDLSKAPYWYPQVGYEPREVHVVETTPPPEHPYGKKIIYVDAQMPMPRYTEIYDKRGEFWKWGTWMSRNELDAQKNPVVATYAGGIFDFKRNHATLFLSSNQPVYNDPAMGEDSLSIGTLESIGGGS